MDLPIYFTIPLFILVLIPLVLIHELGHFVTAKLFGVTAPEFGIGFPPRAFRFWKTAGWIEIQSRHIIVPAKFQLPEATRIGAQVIYKTETRDGYEVLTQLEIVDKESSGYALTSPIQNFDPGTEFTLNWLPLGGFVRLSGEEDPGAPNALAAKPAWQRIIVLVSGVFMNFVLALVIFSILAANLPVLVVAATTHVAAIVEDSPTAQSGIQVGDTIISVEGADVRDNLAELRRNLALHYDTEVTVVVERTSATGIKQIPVRLTPRSKPPAGQGALGVSLNQQAGARVTRVVPGSLAEQIGLRAGDGLVSVGNNFALFNPNAGPFANALRDENDLAKFIQSLRGTSYILPVTYIRDGKIQDPVKLKIPADLPAEQAALGLSMHLNPAEAVQSAGQQMYNAVASVPQLFATLLQRGPQDAGVIGPAGLYRLTGEVARRGGIWGMINLMGVLSLNLAVVNLFPIPGLDGGRLIFILLEIVRGGRKIDPRKEGIVHLIGMVFLLSMMLVFTFFDISNWIAGKPLGGP